MKRLIAGGRKGRSKEDGELDRSESGAGKEERWEGEGKMD
jgi:hypothetical protein